MLYKKGEGGRGEGEGYKKGTLRLYHLNNLNDTEKIKHKALRL